MRSAGPSSSGVSAVRYGLRGALVDLFLATIGVSSSTVRRRPPAMSPDGSTRSRRSSGPPRPSSTEEASGLHGEGHRCPPAQARRLTRKVRLSGPRLEPAVPLETRGPETAGSRRHVPAVQRRWSAPAGWTLLALLTPASSRP